MTDLLLNCHSISKAHGSRQLFEEISLGIFRGDKIGLVGPNGAGKSTLLRILAGIDKADQGTVSCKKSLCIGFVPQNSEYEDLPIEEIILQEFPASSSLPLYERHTLVNILLHKLGFHETTKSAAKLSGGWKKRLDIAKQLIKSPDVLFLDEPTNHLDLEGIFWLETFLKNESIAFLVTSHDRYFLNAVATRMLELNSIYPQGTFSCDGNYAQFLDKRAEYLAHQQKTEHTLATKVKNEVDWLRQSPKARTTKSTARVQEAERLIQELSQVRNRNKQATTKIDFESTDRQTKKLLAAKNLTKTLSDRLLFAGLDLTMNPGMRLGIVGPNGCGKTTLLRLLAGEIEADKGTVKYADGLRIVYFDQHREKLSPEDTLRRALSPNSDTVVYRGQNIHVNSWAKRFLFTPERLDLPVKQLSGGERARIGIARLMLQPADLLLLDEPTNDLDIPTLETLEESLTEFPGAIILITHDRAMLDRIANCVVGLGLPDIVPPLLADINQWETFVKQQKNPSLDTSPSKKNVAQKTAVPLKLSYKEKKELEQMEVAITATELEISQLEAKMHEYSTNNQLNELQETCKKIDAAHQKLDTLFARWQELEDKQKCWIDL